MANLKRGDYRGALKILLALKDVDPEPERTADALEFERLKRDAGEARDLIEELENRLRRRGSA